MLFYLITAFAFSIYAYSKVDSGSVMDALVVGILWPFVVLITIVVVGVAIYHMLEGDNDESKTNDFTGSTSE